MSRLSSDGHVAQEDTHRDWKYLAERRVESVLGIVARPPYGALQKHSCSIRIQRETGSNPSGRHASAQAGKRSGPRTVLRTRTTPNAHSVRLFQADQRRGLDTERMGGRRGRYWTVAADGRTRTRALQTLEESSRDPRPMGVQNRTK